jgi:hypothetical protein
MRSLVKLLLLVFLYTFISGCSQVSREKEFIERNEQGQLVVRDVCGLSVILGGEVADSLIAIVEYVSMSESDFWTVIDMIDTPKYKTPPPTGYEEAKEEPDDYPLIYGGRYYDIMFSRSAQERLRFERSVTSDCSQRPGEPAVFVSWDLIVSISEDGNRIIDTWYTR